LRFNREVVLASLLCLIAVCHGVDSRSISELLSDLEMEDDSQFLSQQPASTDAGGREYDAGDYDDLASIMDDSLPKRAPWAPYEVSVDSLRQKLLRSKMFNNRQKYASTNPDGFNEYFSELSSKDIFADGYISGWLSAKAQLLGGDDQRAVDGGAERGADLAGVLRRLDKRDDPQQGRETRMRSTGSIHPVYLGLGQETANAALSTFASLLAEEEKRKNADTPTNPVRFIGKRYLRDQ